MMMRVGLTSLLLILSIFCSAAWARAHRPNGRHESSDAAKTSTSRRQDVNVTDINDHSPQPQFVSAYFTALDENNDIGAEVLTVRATDRDDGVSGQLTYSIEGDVATWLEIGPTTGVVTAKVSFDREVVDRLDFVVVARDGGAPQRSATVAEVHVFILDVNDERPTFSQTTYEFQLTENAAPGYTVGQVAAVDRDLGSNGQVGYSIVPSLDSEAFAIDQRSGVLTTTRRLDLEEEPPYRLEVRASDHGLPQLASTATVNVYVIAPYGRNRREPPAG